MTGAATTAADPFRRRALACIREGRVTICDLITDTRTWTWGPAGSEREAWLPHSWTTELEARLWAETHLTVCDGPIEVVPSGEEATV